MMFCFIWEIQYVFPKKYNFAYIYFKFHKLDLKNERGVTNTGTCSRACASYLPFSLTSIHILRFEIFIHILPEGHRPMWQTLHIHDGQGT